MKVFVFTKKKMLILFSCIIVAILAIVIGVNTAQSIVSVSNTKREIPIYCVDTNEKKVSISFDAAWGNESTNDLLDTLDKYNVKSTFFVVGSWVDKYPESVKEISDRGHDIGNHSDTHPHMSQLSHDKQVSQIAQCNSKIQSITGVTPILFRAPYGEYNNDIMYSAYENNMYPIQWSIDSLDWKDLSCAEMQERIMKKLQPGAIILLHNGAKNTPEALPSIIESIQSQGYEIVPISQLIYKDNYTIDTQGKQIPNS